MGSRAGSLCFLRPGREPAPALPRTSEQETTMATIETVGTYIAASRRDPRLGRTTLHYIADMIDYFGKAKVFEGIYGMEPQLDDIVAFCRGYAMSMERRLLLLVGPQGSGKSMTVDKLKRRLEEYSHKPDGAVYAVAGCPFHQHPFDLIPLDMPAAEGAKCRCDRSSFPPAIKSAWPSTLPRTCGERTSRTSSATSTSPC